MMKKTKPIGVCIIGYGYWGPNLVRNIRQLSQFKLIAICEKNMEQHIRIREEQSDIEILQHYRDVFTRSDIEATVIATVPSSHFRIAKMALENGKHVLVEKPLTLSVREGQALIKLARERGRTLMVDHTFLYTPAIQTLEQLVRSGTLGTIYSIESVRVNLGLFQRDTNVIWDLAPHDFSILLSLLPERPTHVSAVGSKTIVHPKQERAQESVAHVMLYYASGIVAHIHVSWISPTKVRQLTVIGSNGVAVYDQLAPNQLVVYDRGVYPNQNEGESGPLFIYKTGEARAIPYDHSGEDLARMITDFGKAVQTGNAPRSNATLGLDIVRLLSAAEYSLARQGQKIAIQYKNRYLDFFSRIL